MFYQSSSMLMLLTLVFALSFNPIVNTVEQNDEHASLSGVVFDAVEEIPVEGAEVTLNDHSATTDEEGMFSIGELEEGTHSLTVEHENYEAYETEVTLEEKEEKSIEIALQPVEE